MRQQLILNKCVGITKQGELILVNYLFNDTLHDKPFHGATGSRLCPLSQDYIDDRNDLENVIDTYGYLWQEAVKDGLTTDSQEAYIQGIIDAEVNYGDSMFLGHDTLDVHYIPDDIKKEYFKDAVSFECIGGGRMFPITDNEMEVIFDHDLWEAVNNIEACPQDLSALTLVDAKLIIK